MEKILRRVVESFYLQVRNVFPPISLRDLPCHRTKKMLFLHQISIKLWSVVFLWLQQKSWIRTYPCSLPQYPAPQFFKHLPSIGSNEIPGALVFFFGLLTGSPDRLSGRTPEGSPFHPKWAVHEALPTGPSASRITFSVTTVDGNARIGSRSSFLPLRWSDCTLSRLRAQDRPWEKFPKSVLCVWYRPHTLFGIVLLLGSHSHFKTFSNCLSHNSPANGWPYRFFSRGTTGSSVRTMILAICGR